MTLGWWQIASKARTIEVAREHGYNLALDVEIVSRTTSGEIVIELDGAHWRSGIYEGDPTVELSLLQAGPITAWPCGSLSRTFRLRVLVGRASRYEETEGCKRKGK